MTEDELIKKTINDGIAIANKINATKTISEISQLSDEAERYCDFVDQNFGIVDDFAEDENEKFSDLSFYLQMAIEEKRDHLEYYDMHPNETSDGVLDFLDYLESKTWLQK